VGPISDTGLWFWADCYWQEIVVNEPHILTKRCWHPKAAGWNRVI
jgi:hypothetical protein